LTSLFVRRIFVASIQSISESINRRDWIEDQVEEVIKSQVNKGNKFRISMRAFISRMGDQFFFTMIGSKSIKSLSGQLVDHVLFLCADRSSDSTLLVPCPLH
jgi:hypothetical protein